MIVLAAPAEIGGNHVVWLGCTHKQKQRKDGEEEEEETEKAREWYGLSVILLPNAGDGKEEIDRLEDVVTSLSKDR